MKFHVIEKKKKKDNNSILEGMSKKLGLYPYQNPTRFLILFPFFLSSFLPLLLLIPLPFSQDRRFHRASHYKWTLRFQMKALVKHSRSRTESILLHSWPGSRVVVPLFVKNEPTLLLRICRCN